MTRLVSRSILAAAGMADLACTLLLITGYHAHASSLLLIEEFALLPWQVLNAFTWFGVLIVASGAAGRSFGQMMFGTLIGALVGDSVSVAIRAWIVPSVTLFARVALWDTVALAIVDSAALFFVWLAITAPDDDNEQEKEKKKTPRESWNRLAVRRFLPWLWTIELILVALQLSFFSLGLNRTATFSRVIVLEAPHAFVWLIHRAISGGYATDDGMRQAGWISMGILLSGTLALVGFAASALRLYYALSNADAEIDPSSLAYVWGWTQFGLGVALTSASFAQALALVSISIDEPREDVPLKKVSIEMEK